MIIPNSLIRKKSAGFLRKCFRVNWRDSDTIMAIKCSHNSTIKEIINEVNIIIKNTDYYKYHTLIKYINLFKNILDKNATQS